MIMFVVGPLIQVKIPANASKARPLGDEDYGLDASFDAAFNPSGHGVKASKPSIPIIL